MTAPTSASRGPAARRLRIAAAASLALGLSSAVLATPSQAAPASPRLLGPAGDVQGTPEIRWAAVTGATTYEVQVDDSDDFASPEFKASTVNRTATPTAPLKPGTFHYRVRAKDSSKAWSDWSQGEFTQEEASQPVLIAPGDGSLVRRPEDQALLSWTSVPGASSYTVEFDTEINFVGADSATTKSTSMVTPSGQKPGIPYYWRVRASLASGVHGGWSDPWSYSIGELPTPVITGPTDAQEVTDVALDWNPVPGASHYEVQVDDDRNFNSPESGIPAKITSTRWSPEKTFINRQYFWRVRAVDADGNTSAWAKAADGDWSTFERVWRDKPELVHPVDASVSPDTAVGQRSTVNVDGDLYFEWTPVEHASRYRVDLSTDVNFSPARTTSCTVVGTVYTPGFASDGCYPKSYGLTYFWRVLPIDEPSGNSVIEGLYSQAQSFVYNKTLDPRDEIDFLFPHQPPAEDPYVVVDVPTISWKSRTATTSYQAEILGANDVPVTSQKVTSTSWTPSVKLDASKGPFRARVTATDHAKASSMTFTSPYWFQVSGLDAVTGLDPLEPAAVAAGATNPQLRWGTHPGAEHYRVHVKRADSSGWLLPSAAELLDTRWPYPSAQSVDYDPDLASPGRYLWYVTAHDKDGNTLATGDEGSYTITDLAPVTGHEIAITGTALDRGDTCATDASRPTAQICDSVPTTPVLNWDHVPGAAFYKVYVSRDADFTTGLVWDADEQVTVNSRWYPRATPTPGALPDSQALSAYYWYVQPCKSASLCAPSPLSVQSPSVHAFRKTSPKVELLEPAHQANPDSPTQVVSTTEVNFAWKPYLTTNRATVHSASKVASHQSARVHEIQVATEPTFAKPITSARVDQPFYTAPSSIYPEGPLYWRVRAVDGNKNDLTWSNVRTLVKRSPSPKLVSPANGGRATPLTPFSWDDMPYTSTWTLQVAKNDDTNFSSTNLVVNRTGIKRSTFATGAGTKLLAASDTPYVWRVRQVFPGSVVGAWSDVRRFTVSSQTPTLLAPASGATVDATTAVMRWAPVPSATRHKVQYRDTTGTSIKSVTTAANAYAPTSALAAGKTYEWRVQALDPDSTVIGSTSWRKFTVKGTPAGGSNTGTNKPTTKPKTKPKTKSASKTSITKPKKVKAKNGKARAKVKITVKATAKGAAKPTGKVKVYVKGKAVGTGKLNSKGTVKIKLKKLKVGKHKLTAKYLGNSRTKASTSKKQTLRIVR